MKLDVSRLPTEAIFKTGEGDAQINLAEIPRRMRPAISELARARLIENKNSFGFAAAKPSPASFHWDDPYEFTWFVAGWGTDRDRYIANAVRKLRAALRAGYDTLEMRILYPGTFHDTVESKEDDGSFEWGDFPWGGATFVRVGKLLIPSSVSCLLEVEDDAVAKAIGGLIGAQILQISNPDEFGPNS